MPSANSTLQRSKLRLKRKAIPPAKPRRATPDCAWIRTLATPYLRGYRAVAESRGSLCGYRFLAEAKIGSRSSRGFFVGYILESSKIKVSARNYAFLKPAPPECLVFAFLEPVDSPTYRQLVSAEGSLLRRTTEYIGWLTHRPPRFALFTDQHAVLVRHFSMKNWPKAKHQHFSRNFFIETLAWLVRSGLVAKLLPAPISNPSGRLPKK
jgi:hypothetical protein